jgi:hypothetical protein
MQTMRRWPPYMVEGSCPTTLRSASSACCLSPRWHAQSTTSRSFQAAFIAQRDKEQGARQQLALNCFGRERIACIAGLVETFLKGEALNLPGFANGSTHFWVSVDGRMHGVDDTGPLQRGGEPMYPAGEMHVDTWVVKETPPTLRILVFWGNPVPIVILAVSPCENITVRTHVWRDEDVLGVALALAQALVSGVGAPTHHDGGRPVSVLVAASFPADTGMHARVQLRVAPLLPLASFFRFEAFAGCGPGCFFKEYAKSRQGGTTANPGITLCVFHLHQRMALLAIALEYKKVLELVFENLSLGDLARVSSTCITLRNAVLRRLGIRGWCLSSAA